MPTLSFGSKADLSVRSLSVSGDITLANGTVILKSTSEVAGDVLFGARALGGNSSDSVGVGIDAYVGATSVSLGHGAVSAGSQSIVIGHEAVLGENDNQSIAIGASASAVGGSASGHVLLGTSTAANGALAGCTVIGSFAVSTGSNSVAVGLRASVEGTGVAVGSDATATNSAVAVGEDATTTVPGVCIGRDADLTGAGGIAVGQNANVSQAGGVALGQSAIVSGAADGIAIGNGASATSGGIAIGNGISVTSGGRWGASLRVDGNFAANGKVPVAQAAKIDDPSGGATQDAEARTAINAIIDVLEDTGLAALI